MWVSHHSFKKLVDSWWKECHVDGWEGFWFMQRLAFVKQKLKRWNKSTFGFINEKKNHLLSDL